VESSAGYLAIVSIVSGTLITVELSLYLPAARWLGKMLCALDLEEHSQDEYANWKTASVGIHLATHLTDQEYVSELLAGLEELIKARIPTEQVARTEDSPSGVGGTAKRS
jgi:hypothetical protein